MRSEPRARHLGRDSRAADPRLRVFGVRHHGPGSAASLVAALDALGPECVLIEGPSDANVLIPFAALPGTVPPVALMVQSVADRGRAGFYPFAEYSPEWQALRWADAHGREVAFIDLPMAASGTDGVETAHERADGDAGAGDDAGRDGEAITVADDPLGTLARLAGQDDGEAWWSSLVERSVHGGAVFEAIAEAVRDLREAAEEVEGGGATRPNGADPEREDRREAWMRLRIRDALVATEGTVAVVCGAWHVPAFERAVPAARDQATLAGFAAESVECAWVPWTDPRLARASGYGAGVISPGWYRHLWERSRAPAGEAGATAAWQTGVARAAARGGYGGLDGRGHRRGALGRCACRGARAGATRAG